MMLDPSVKFNESDAFLHELSIGNQKCENDDGLPESWSLRVDHASKATQWLNISYSKSFNYLTLCNNAHGTLNANITVWLVPQSTSELLNSTCEP